MGGVVDILITYPEVVPGLLVIGEIKPKTGGGALAAACSYAEGGQCEEEVAPW